MKKFIFILLLFSSIKSFSQANFSRIGLGLGGGLTTAYTGMAYGLSPIIPGFNPSKGLTTNKNKYFGGTLDYYFTPFITAGISYDNITIKDGTDKWNRAFISKFNAIELKGKVAVGQFVDFSSTPFLYTLRNLNVSLGVGFISGSNNVGEFGSGTFPSRQHANDLGKSKFSGVVSLPMSVGYFINIYDAYQEPKIVIGINYKFVYTFSDDLDGYNDDPAYFSNDLKDIYTTTGISIKYLFGPKGLYYR